MYEKTSGKGESASEARLVRNDLGEHFDHRWPAGDSGRSVEHRQQDRQRAGVEEGPCGRQPAANGSQDIAHCYCDTVDGRLAKPICEKKNSVAVADGGPVNATERKSK